MNTAPTRMAHFLLVEDDNDHAYLIRRSLEQNGILSRISHVTDGRQAMAYLRHEGPFADAERPDVILLDLKLPIMDGHEVLRAVKSDANLKTIPIVVLTTSNADQDLARAYAENVNSYLVKPVNFDQLHEMLLQLKLYWALWNKQPL